MSYLVRSRGGWRLEEERPKIIDVKGNGKDGLKSMNRAIYSSKTMITQRVAWEGFLRQNSLRNRNAEMIV